MTLPKDKTLAALARQRLSKAQRKSWASGTRKLTGPRSEETKEKIRQSALYRYQDPAMRKKTSDALKQAYREGRVVTLRRRGPLRKYDKRGVVLLWINNRRISAHRFVLETILKRPLRSDEHVHHLDGNPSNNKPQNLVLVTPRLHNLIHRTEYMLRLVLKEEPKLLSAFFDKLNAINVAQT
mgnify:CR=1 FL=1